jgi:hypothetical protein
VRKVVYDPILTMRIEVDFTSYQEGVRRCFFQSLFIMPRVKSKRFFQQNHYMKDTGGGIVKPKDFHPSIKAENLQNLKV